jgi:hypothetical protein
LHYSTMMERFLLCAGLTAFLAVGVVRAQTSLQVIQDDLKTAKAQHDDANSQVVTTFLSSLAEASGNPSAALDLYQKAGGELPEATAVKSRYDYETPTERAKRQAADLRIYNNFAEMVEVHCGLMRNAALLTVQPNKPGVQADWLTWLKETAQLYPQLTGDADPKAVAMKDSVINRYFDFHGWGKSDMGTWTVSAIPNLYRTQVLEPLRQRPSPATLEAWDTYIAMREADETDTEKWTHEIQPELAFDRGADDFAIRPTMEKLATLDAIIKDNPSSDHLDSWLSRMQGMIAIYQGHGISSSPLPGATPSTPSSEVGGDIPAATPGSSTTEVAGTMPTATPSATPVSSGGPVSGAVSGTPSSEVGGPTPTATPGAAPVPSYGQVSGATPSTPSSETGGPIPTATPGTPSSGEGFPTPTASPGSPSSGGGSPLPTATPSTPSSGGLAAPTGTP